MLLAERWHTILGILRHPANAGRRGGALRDYLRWNLGQRALGIDYVLPLVDGARLILSARQNYATLVYTCRLWDFPEQAFLLHLLRQEDTFVDIGANVGGYTVLASAVAGARSIAFEPVPESFSELRRNVMLNDIAPLVQMHCSALGEQAGTIYMTAARGGLNHVVTNATPADRVPADRVPADTVPANIVEVPVARLDAILAGTTCRLIKIDAEGFELPILRGAAETLSRPGLQALIIELNGSGARYGVSDDEVHREVTRFSFEPCDYDAATRTLIPRRSYNRTGLNTLYVRDRAAAAARLAEARRFSLLDRSF